MSVNKLHFELQMVDIMYQTNIYQRYIKYEFYRLFSVYICLF